MIKATIAASVMALSAVCCMAQHTETPLVKIGNETYSLEEFNTIYEKNNSVAQVSISREEYFELFIRYKLKVQEARSLGYDTLPDYRRELGDYRSELIQLYMCDSTTIKEKRAAIEERLKMEINAEHILILARENASPADTLAAYNKCNEARNLVLQGLPFDSIARVYSQDPSAKQNGGKLGYFTALQMVEPFEDAAYNTPIGECSKVFRTSYGYHFVHVIDKRKWSGEMRIAHIMKAKNNPKVDAKAFMDSLYTLLKSNVDFPAMAMKHSDDQQTANRGGEMGWIPLGVLIPQFAEPCRGLANNGDITLPFETPFGWHIAKRLDFREGREAAVVDNMIARIHGPNWLRTLGREAYINRKAKELNLRFNEAIVAELEKIFANEKNSSAIVAKIKELKGDLLTYDGGAYAASNGAEIFHIWDADKTVEENKKSLARNILLTYCMENLEKIDAKFHYAYEEYKDGLLVFEITQRTIWSNRPDSIAMQKLYDSNPRRYSNGSTFDGNIYFCATERDAAKLRSMVPVKPRKVSKAAKYAYNIVSGTQRQGGIYDDYLWPNKPLANIVVDGKFTDGEVLPIDSVRGLLSSDYQQLEEDKWIESLRQKYGVKMLREL
ncbi:MAG: peptidylprolyl isomerase [Marinilabiliaceae bacterium]|nr:peptidylprolyl isomerase [Marinilabiliaceae bacterium]